MFSRFVLCLLPAAIAFIMLAAGTAGWIPQTDIYGYIVFALLIIGGIACAVMLTLKVHRRSEHDPVAKWTLSILTFLGVAVAYGAIVFGGCCGILLVGANLA